MSNISANIIVDTNPINVQVEQSEVGITVEPINLNIYSAGFSNPGGNIGQLQYNAGVLAGVPNVTFISGNLSLGNVANVKMLGGSSAYYLQTDGAGNLTWAPGTANITGNGTAAGANNAIQLSTGTGNFKVGTGFNFDPSSNVLDVPGNATANYFIGNFFVGNGSSLTAINGSNVTGTVANATFALDAGNANSVAGANVTGEVAFAAVANSVAGSNVSGQVAFANMANYAGNVTVAAQSNITSLGTLTSLSVAGTSSIQQAIEKVTVNASAATGNINYDLLDQAILNHTANASGNITLNFRGNGTTTLNTVMNNNTSMTCTFITSTGPTPYVVSNVKVDGTSVTPVWTLPGSAGTGTPSGKDVYTFNLIKTAANAFTVLASRVGYI